jgi:hypothetical protein
MKFVDAPRNDSVSMIAALAHARFLYKDILKFDSFIGDAIHDNYPTYDLLHQWNIKPFIPLSDRSDNKLQVDGLTLSPAGVPVRADGHDMANWGYDRAKPKLPTNNPHKSTKNTENT